MAKQHGNAATCVHCRRLIVRAVMELQRPRAAVARDFDVSVPTVRKWVRRYSELGPAGLSDRSSRPHRIARQYAKPGPFLEQAVFALLHSPPAVCGYNRTTWRMDDLRAELAAKGALASGANVRAVIRQAGYSWKNARVALTSTDPDYRTKLDAIKSTLAALTGRDYFFSVDEFGPFAIRKRGGKSLQPSGAVAVVPQWQRSKGSTIVTAALELSTNQVTHFFSERKNTEETVRLVEFLRRSYRHAGRIFVSWDAAPWHSSKKLLDRVQFLNEWAKHDNAPEITLLPLPSCAQFLNVIESVFSGMARAVIHNSDYASVEEAQAAISRYLRERNEHFSRNPRRAGKTIWKREQVPSSFSEANNCKDRRYA